MKRKKVRMVSWLLLAVVLVVEIFGNRTAAYAMQPKTEVDEKGDIVSPETGEEKNDRQAQETVPGMEQAFTELLQEYDMYGMLINGSEIAVYQEPSFSAPVVRILPSGYQMRFLGAFLSGEELWYQAAFRVNDREYNGFIEDSYVLTQDERLAEWKNQYLGTASYARGTAGLNAAAQGKTDLSAFPSSYRPYIKKLIAAHPNWTFVPMNTGLKWSDVLSNEMVNTRNLVDSEDPRTLITWKSRAAEDYNMSTGQWVIKNGTTWVQASEEIVKYYLDPRNFLNEESVFQFEQLVYNKSYHTESGVEKILSGTFMSKKKLEDGSGGKITYAKAFMKIGKKLKVSPYFLASRVRQEQGVKGTSGLISGKYKGYKGYYNYFNISATGVGKQVIISGLTEAKKEGWTTRYKALYGGAKKTAANYIFRGQDTLYLQKFDVDSSDGALYWHQYMQNLLAADNESKNVKNSYISQGLINQAFVFKVPVYTGMPSKACPYPGEKLSKPSLKAEKKEPGTVELSWNKIVCADGYQIYRKEGTDGKYEKIKTIKKQSKVSYQDKTAVPGKVYCYKVRAYLKLYPKNMTSSYSKEQTVDCSVSATAWSRFTVNGSAVQLTWKKKDVTGYRIYRKTDSGKYACIKTIKSGKTVSYEDTTALPSHTYTYRIRSYQSVNNKKYYSSYTGVKQAQITMSASKARAKKK